MIEEGPYIESRKFYCETSSNVVRCWSCCPYFEWDPDKQYEQSTLIPPNEPLTLEELEGFVEPTPVWWDWVCGWVLARKGMIVTWDWRYHNVKELKLKGNFYRRPPEGKEDHHG